MNLTTFFKPGFKSNFDRSLSDDAGKLRKVVDAEPADNSISLGLQKQKMLRDLDDAFRHSIMDGWNGYNARAADISAYLYAQDFLALLPAFLPSPEIAIDHDGDVAVEWDLGPRRIISIRIGRDGSISYAWLVGYASFHGTEMFRETIPDLISYGIERVVGSSRQ